MQLTAEQEQIGRANFTEAVGATRTDVIQDVNRRTFLKGAGAVAVGMGAVYFGYDALKGDPVRVGFIGTGDEGNILITQHPKDYMQIVSIADIRPTNLQRAMRGDGNEHRIGLIEKLDEEQAGKIAQYKDHRELIANAKKDGIEAVVIAVPLNQHAPIAMEAMEAGLHVLTEKLMAHNITECKQMIKKAEEKGLLLAVGHQRHYSVLYDNANTLVQNGLLGDVRYIRAQWHRNNSFPGKDSWRKKIPKKDAEALEGKTEQYGFDDMNQLVNWRLYNETGGGLMAELGSHQLDAASIFLGKVHPIAVQGFGEKIFYGVEGLGTEQQQEDDRDIADHVFVTFEFPGPNYDREQNPRDVRVVTYSSISTNKNEPYGEWVFGSRGTLAMKTEKEALLFKEEGGGGAGGLDQRLHVIKSDAGGPVLDSYETTTPSQAAGAATQAMGDEISRGYTEEMEHFCHCIRTGENNLRCPGRVAMADAIMALTSNIAMKLRRRIEFRDEWFEVDNPAVPEDLLTDGPIA